MRYLLRPDVRTPFPLGDPEGHVLNQSSVIDVERGRVFWDGTHVCGTVVEKPLLGLVGDGTLRPLHEVLAERMR